MKVIILFCFLINFFFVKNEKCQTLCTETCESKSKVYATLLRGKITCYCYKDYKRSVEDISFFPCTKNGLKFPDQKLIPKKKYYEEITFTSKSRRKVKNLEIHVEEPKQTKYNTISSFESVNELSCCE
jgi:hypothetical protein